MDEGRRCSSNRPACRSNPACRCGVRCRCGPTSCGCTDLCRDKASKVIDSLGWQDLHSSSKEKTLPKKSCPSPTARSTAKDETASLAESAANRSEEKEEEKRKQRAVIRVEGMTCGACVGTVRSVVASTIETNKDSNAIDVDLKNGMAYVSSVDETTAMQIAQGIDSVGFDAKFLRMETAPQTFETAEKNHCQTEQYTGPKDERAGGPLMATNNDSIRDSQPPLVDTSPLHQHEEENDGIRTGTVRFTIKGMTCSMCSRAITRSLESLDVVKSVKVSLATDMAIVTYALPPHDNHQYEKQGMQNKNHVLIEGSEQDEEEGFDNDIVNPEASGLVEVAIIAQIKQQIIRTGYDATEFRDSAGATANDANNHEDANDDETGYDRLTRAQVDEVTNRRQAFLFSLLGTLPILFLTMIVPLLWHTSSGFRFWLNECSVLGFLTREALFLWLLATPVQFLSGWVFYRGALRSLRSGVLGMDVLVALGTSASYGYAAISALQERCRRPNGTDEGSGAHFFETSAVLICFVLLGKWMQSLAVRRTSDALAKLMQLQAKIAVVVEPNPSPEEEDNPQGEQQRQDEPLANASHEFNPTKDLYIQREVPIDRVNPNDTVKIIRGASIPADGIVSHGEMTVDESMITGESVPVLKTPGSVVLGGTICIECGSSPDGNAKNGNNGSGAAFVKVTGVGASTALSQILKLVEEAQANQAPIQALADSVSSIFVPTVCILSVLTFVVWFSLCLAGVVPSSWYETRDESALTFSFMFAIACLVISCPCALGLATPTAVMVGSGVGASNGVLMKGGEALQKASEVDALVFDKTGTLTKGEPAVTDFVRVDSDSNQPSNDSLLWFLGSLERNSEHPLASAIVSYAEQQMSADFLASNPFGQPSDFRASTGRGASCQLDGRNISIGNRAFAAMMSIPLSPTVENIMQRLEMEGKTAILASLDSAVAAVIGVADEIKPDAALALAKLRQMGIDVWMVTGDNTRTAMAISRQLNFPSPNRRVIAEALPAAKVRQVKTLQNDGRTVAMVGDGINDSPALAQADVGIGMGSGTEIAAEASDMILIRGNVMDVCTALDLSRFIIRRIKLNLLFSLLYNTLGLPIAAGVFFPLVKTRLPPSLAAAAMALSSVSIVCSSLTIRLYKPPSVQDTIDRDDNGGGRRRSTTVYRLTEPIRRFFNGGINLEEDEDPRLERLLPLVDETI